MGFISPDFPSIMPLPLIKIAKNQRKFNKRTCREAGGKLSFLLTEESVEAFFLFKKLKVFENIKTFS